MGGPGQSDYLCEQRYKKKDGQTRKKLINDIITIYVGKNIIYLEKFLNLLLLRCADAGISAISEKGEQID